MPSQLLKNEAISFIVGKTFLFKGETYERGDSFDQDEVRIPMNNIETFVRNRYLIPVVDSYDDKPRHWYREIKLRSDVEARMGLEQPVQIVDPDGEGIESPHDIVDSGPPVDGGEGSRAPAGYDPGEHTIREVKAHVDANPGDLETIITSEENGQARSTLLTWLYEQRDAGG